MRFQVTLFCGSLILQIRWSFFNTFSGHNFCDWSRGLFFFFNLQYILQFSKFELIIRALINSQRVELIKKSWFDCPENILSVSWVHYIQWEQRNQNSRSEWFYIKNCLSFVLQVLTPVLLPLSVITMKFQIKSCFKK